ncbi:hypothetical protein CROQUDRAFT_99231 [Cronartium quercuum f. sp. fusiforme G11]|uniref:Uncharacterized protein n=1 Tax=Cronartium quercuum f. sp. fusiforme G11 TaxID=708437 RepID=A0A9P6NB76_9BASI|nr:hypothetical protein CROQUDRAFT_99231 [Cronartium quercuum f. sp. fusiforme G11]
MDPSISAPPLSEEQDDYTVFPGGEGVHQDEQPTTTLDPLQLEDLGEPTTETPDTPPPLTITVKETLPHRLTHLRNPTNCYHPSANLAYWHDPNAFTDTNDIFTQAFTIRCIIHLVDEPPNYKAAMTGRDRDEWIAACDKEMNNIVSNLLLSGKIAY